MRLELLLVDHPVTIGVHALKGSLAPIGIGAIIVVVIAITHVLRPVIIVVVFATILGAPLPEQRIQVWAHTTEGHERDPHSHGATLTDANGEFCLEMPQIVPAFGQAHGHLAYDSGDFKTVFLRPVMGSSSDTTLHADFVLQPA